MEHSELLQCVCIHKNEWLFFLSKFSDDLNVKLKEQWCNTVLYALCYCERRPCTKISCKVLYSMNQLTANISPTTDKNILYGIFSFIRIIVAQHCGDRLKQIFDIVGNEFEIFCTLLGKKIRKKSAYLYAILKRSLAQRRMLKASRRNWPQSIFMPKNGGEQSIWKID